MSFYQTFTSVRTAEPDRVALVAQVRALDATVGIQHVPGSSDYTVKKATAWTAAQIATAQNIIDTAPASTPELTAQSTVDAWPVELRALVLTLIDQLNVIRAALPTPLAAITPAQALAAVRTKAGTL